MRAHLVLLAEKQPELSCDCPARLHDKERPLELEVSPSLSPALTEVFSCRTTSTTSNGAGQHQLRIQQSL